MGYYIYQRETEFRIPVEKVEEALHRLRTVNGISWQRTGEDATIEEAFRNRRWSIIRGVAGDIVGISFEGEKAGDDEKIFDAIAPCVDDESYITMQGEEGEQWRWLFEKGKLREQQAKIVWED